MFIVWQKNAVYYSGWLYCQSLLFQYTSFMLTPLSFSNGSWIYNYLCNQCISPHASSNPAHGEVYSILHYVIKLSVTCGRSVVFSGYSGPVSSINKTDCHDITEILLKVALIWFKHIVLSNIYNMIEHKFYNLYEVLSKVSLEHPNPNLNPLSFSNLF